jgi:lipoprotein-anchoring transpeptidase ErfK/SrfK
MIGRFIKDAFRNSGKGRGDSALIAEARRKSRGLQPSKSNDLIRRGAFRPVFAMLVLSICAPFANPAMSAAASTAPEGASKTAGSAAAAGATKSAPAANEAVAVATEARTHLAEKGYLAGSDQPSNQPSAERLHYAMLAFERVAGLKQTGTMDRAELEALKSAANPQPRETGYAHIEVDLTHQFLMVLDASNNIIRVLPISSGSGKTYTFEGKTDRAVTPRGRFVVYNKISGWRKAPLGMIYYPCYFDKGVAIHGSSKIPNYPASHGCVRIPIVTAKELSDLTPVGTVVLVYDSETATPDSSTHSS